MDMNQFIFILSFLLFFIMTASFIQPFRIHRKRKISTISLKVSYLLYQFMFLVFLYFMIFTDKPVQRETYGTSSAFVNPYFLLFVIAAIIPNIAIIIRRKIKNKRTEYNLAITLTNVLFFLYLLILTVVQEYTRF